MTAFTTYLKHVRDELQHVVWPTTRTAVSHTLVVMLISAVIALFVGLLDYVFGGAVSQLIGA